MNLVFQHLRDTKNIGDRWCSPYDYFDWPKAKARDIREKSDAFDFGIYGGGKIFGGFPKYAGVQKDSAAFQVAWGVSTVQKFPISLRYARARRMMDVVGSRDYGDTRFPWVPCASCMASGFDAPAEPIHDVVFYFHGGKTQKQGIEIPNTIPSLSNNVGSLKEALAFIASGRTVVSNSYHGVYWGLLMKRRVLCIPFSNKFNAYRQAPAYATPKNWLNKLESAVARPEMLELCRARTLEFKAEVDQYIDQRHQSG